MIVTSGLHLLCVVCSRVSATPDSDCLTCRRCVADSKDKEQESEDMELAEANDQPVTTDHDHDDDSQSTGNDHGMTSSFKRARRPRRRHALHRDVTQVLSH